MEIILTGTDSRSRAGGIGFVMPGYLDALNEAGIPVHQVPTYHPTTPGGRFLPWIIGLPRLMFKTVKLRSRGRVPVIYSHAGPGVSLFREMIVLMAGRACGAKTVLHVHTPKIDQYLGSGWKRRLLKISLLPAQVVVVLTPWWKEQLHNSGFTNRIAVVPNPLPSDLRERALNGNGHNRNRKDAGGVTVLTMGRLVRGKGVDVAIRAMQYLDGETRLVIAGDGEQRAELEQLATELGMSGRVRFVGWVSGEMKAELLEQADVFCLPSVYDAFPMTFMEAMAFGVPVVGIRWGGIPDVVPETTGVLVDRAEPELVAGAIASLRQPEQRASMGRAGTEWVLGICHPENVGQQIVQVLRTLSG
jgi:glycosyltransferase involved in cell wall biosynthesis